MALGNKKEIPRHPFVFPVHTMFRTVNKWTAPTLSEKQNERYQRALIIFRKLSVKTKYNDNGFQKWQQVLRKLPSLYFLAST